MTSILLWLALAVFGCFLGYGFARWLIARFFPSAEHPGIARDEAKSLRERSRQVKANAMRDRPYSPDDFDNAFNLRGGGRKRHKGEND